MVHVCVATSNQISSKTQDNQMVVPRARRQLGGMGGLNYLLLLRCFKIVPILGLVVYTIALLVPSMVQPFNIRGVQEVLSSLKANEAPGYASSGSDAAVKNAVVHIGPHKTYWFGNGRSLESYFDLLKPYLSNQ